MNRKAAATLIIIVLIALLAVSSCGLLPFDKNGSIKGFVLLEDGEPGNDVRVIVSDGENSYYTDTGSDGTFKIQDILGSTCTVSFIKTGYTTVKMENVPLSAGKTVDLGTITLMAKRGTVSGTVTNDDGVPLENALVTLSGNGRDYSVRTDAQGKYSVTVRSGKYTDVDIAYPDHNLKATVDITVKADSEVRNQDFSVPFNHNYVLMEMVEPTKTTEGYRKYECTDCHDFYTNRIAKVDLAKWAGVRVSPYGMEESFGSFPGVTDMVGFGEKMEGCYEGSIGTYIFIVGTVDEDVWTCHLGFPLSKEIKMVYGTDVDLYEAYLDAFDEAGYSVWLQVEPGNANLVDLATEVLNHYKHHSCVKGLGIDVEWYKPEGTEGHGTPLDKTEARKVLTAVRKINSDYTVFIKHWIDDYLTEGEPVSGFIYVNDSQGFRPRKDKTALEVMCREFANWAETFSSCPVMFQIGYESDQQRVWGSMDNPAEELGTAIANACKEKGTTNYRGIIWVDFTLKEAMDKIPEDIPE